MSIIPIGCFADESGSSSHTVRWSFKIFERVRILSHAHRTVTMDILEPVSQCDKRPPYESQGYHHVSGCLLSGTAKNPQCVVSLRDALHLPLSLNLH